MQTDRREFLLGTAAGVAALALLPEFLPAAIRADGELTVGLIGAGRQGRAILGELQKIPAAKIVAVCDIDESRLKTGVGRVTGADGFAEYKLMLERKDIAAVIVATPTHLHKQIVLDAIAAGKHVYCEAPMAHTLEDCRAMASAAAGAKSIVQVGLEGRSNPIYKLARSFFRSESVRDLVMMRAQNNQKTSWKLPASTPEREKEVNWRLDPAVSLGLEGELGTPQFDVFNWYTNSYPTSVRASGAIRFHKDGRTVPDTVACDLLFPSGARLLYHASLASSYEGKAEYFYGSNATIKLAWNAGWMFKEADAPTQGWEVYANKLRYYNEDGITLIADATKLASQGKLKEGVGLPNPSVYYSLSDFIASVVESKPVACSADEGLRAAVIGISAHQAVVTGQEVKIEEAMLKGG